MFKLTLLVNLQRGAFIGALLVSGCQNASGPNSNHSDPVTLVRSGANSQNNPKSNVPDVPETCQSRLQDRLCEAMLFYYTFNQTFPGKLEDLIGYEGVRSQADLRCPISGKPYIYNPDSTLVLDKELWEVKGGVDPKAVKQNLRYKVLLYDAQPHGEFRFGIVRLIRIDDAGREISSFDNPSLYVVPIPEDQFRLKLNLPN
jgi:hypothetical protein